MNYKRKLSFAQLIRLMREVLTNYGLSTCKDAISDIADLSECYELAKQSNSYVERFWGIKDTGTVMCRTCDFGIWEGHIVERFRIMWSENSEWTFEEL